MYAVVMPRSCCNLMAVGGIILGACLSVVATACNKDDAPDKPRARQYSVLDRPPQPQFSEPVDYVAWYRARHFEDDWPCGRVVYPFLFQDDADSPFDLDRQLSMALDGATKGPWSPAERPELAAYLTKLGPYLEAYESGTTTDNVRWFCGVNSWWPDPHPNYDASRVLAKATLAKAWMDESNGDDRGAALLDAVAVNLRHARHLRHAGATAFLVNAGIRAVNDQALRRALATRLLTDRDATTVLQLLTSADGPADLAEAHRYDWSALLDLLQRLYPGGTYSSAAAAKLDLDQYLHGGASLPAPERTAKKIDAWFAPYVEAAERPLSVETYKELSRRDREKHADGNLLLGVVLPSLRMPYVLALAIETERRATNLVVGLHMYKTENGQWPASLDPLDTNSPSIKIDPCSGHEFRYEVRGRQPWLYSVGLDGKDNGGKHHPKATLSDKAAGFDLVFLPVDGND